MFIKTNMVVEAVGLMKPTIQQMLKSSGKKGLHIAVVVGEHPENDQNMKNTGYPIISNFDIGDRIEKYVNCATGKARLSWRTTAPSGVISARYPELLQPGDCVYTGGVAEATENFCIAVGVSGLNDYEDEALAKSILAFIRARMIAWVRVITQTSEGMVH